ncbi:MAG: EAL domain-containing protein [Acidobacteria bacterium]|nr:MAG: EAL domain-containing protein [Acidobacteriota bacterium]
MHARSQEESGWWRAAKRATDPFVPSSLAHDLGAVRRARLIAGADVILIATGILGLSARLLLGPLPPVVLAIAFTSIAIWALVPLLVKAGGHLDLGGVLTTFGLFLAVLGGAPAVGGLEAPVLALAPIVPLLGSFLVSLRFGLAMAVVTAAAAGVLALPPVVSRLAPPSVFAPQTNAAHALMLALAAFLATAFAWLFERQRQRVERLMLEGEQRYRRLFEHARDPVVVSTLDGRLLEANQAAVELYGYDDVEQMRRLDVREFYVDPQARETLLRRLRKDGFVAAFEARQRTRRGSVITVSGTTSLLRDADGTTTGLLAILRDVTAQKEHEEELRRRASSDPLTGLANRYAFESQLEQAIARCDRFGHRLAVMILDLDGLKAINDSLGHAAGDAMLVEVARRLRANVRRADTLARIGGDELAVIKSDFDEPEHAAQLARRLVAALSGPVAIEGQTVEIGVSAGIAVFPPGPKDPEALIKQADIALYRAKAQGGNAYCFFDQDIDHEVGLRLSLGRDLRHAVERGELELDYQPQIDLADGRVVAFEALLRWNHPQRGRIAPAQFLAIAERTGLILPIGAWVMENACRQAQEWRREHLGPLALAVNASAVELRKNGFVEDLEQLLSDVGLPATALELELDEETLMQAPHAIARTLRGLHELGVRLVLDNFGHAASSLVRLRRFAFDKVKIDPSLAGRVDRDRDAAAIVGAIVAMGQRLNLEVVAEGVESHAQLRYLRREGCHLAQGNHVSPPVTPAAALRLLFDCNMAIG